MKNLLQEINKIREAALKIYEDMKENKQKYQDYLEANGDIQHEINKTQKSVSELKLLIHNKQVEIERLHSEVRTQTGTIGVNYYQTDCRIDKNVNRFQLLKNL